MITCETKCQCRRTPFPIGHRTHAELEFVGCQEHSRSVGRHFCLPFSNSSLSSGESSSESKKSCIISSSWQMHVDSSSESPSERSSARRLLYFGLSCVFGHPFSASSRQFAADRPSSRGRLRVRGSAALSTERMCVVAKYNLKTEGSLSQFVVPFSPSPDNGEKLR